jgi:hypothetical protein
MSIFSGGESGQSFKRFRRKMVGATGFESSWMVSRLFRNVRKTVVKIGDYSLFIFWPHERSYTRNAILLSGSVREFSS